MIQNYLHKYCSLCEMSLKCSSWHTKNTELVQRMMGTLWQTAGHLASSSPRQHTLPSPPHPPTATVPGGVSTVTGRVSVRRSNLPVCATALPSDWPLHAAMETQAEGSMERGAATPSRVCVWTCVFWSFLDAPALMGPLMQMFIKTWKLVKFEKCTTETKISLYGLFVSKRISV